MRNELRDLTAHARTHFVRVTEVDSRIHSSIDYFLNTGAETIPLPCDARQRNCYRLSRIVTKLVRQNVSHRTAVRAVCRWILRMWWRRNKRLPRRGANSRVIAINIAAHNRRLRAPKVVFVLRSPASDTRVGRRQVEQRKQPRLLREIQVAWLHNLRQNVVPDRRWGSTPELRDLTLFGGASRSEINSDLFDLVEVTRILIAIERRRRTRIELRSASKHKRSYVSPTGQQCRSIVESHPNARIAGASSVVSKLSFLRMIVRSDREDRGCRRATKVDPGITGR